MAVPPDDLMLREAVEAGEAPLEVYAHLIHIIPGHMGFEMEHLDEDQLRPLTELLSAGLGEDLIREELQALEETRREHDG